MSRARCILRDRGPTGLSAAISARAQGSGALNYRLEDPSGRVGTGNLPRPKGVEGPTPLGWRDDPTREDADEDEDRQRSLTTALPDGGRLVVAEELLGLTQARRAVFVAFAWALAATAALGVIGGLILARVFLRRIDGMRAVADAFAEGRLDRRLPEQGAGREWDRLVHTFSIPRARRPATAWASVWRRPSPSFTISTSSRRMRSPV